MPNARIYLIFIFSLFFFNISFADDLKEISQEELYDIDIVKEFYDKKQYLTALSILKEIPETNDTKVLKAKIYIDMEMYSDAQKSLEGTTGSDAETLKFLVKREKGFLFFPNYMLYNQELSEEFDLDYERYGLYLSEKGAYNTDFYIDYGIYAYNSGGVNNETNVTNEIKGGLHARPKEKVEFDINIGGKFFQYDIGNMLITDTWLKYYVNDKTFYRFGFYRDNVDQSFLSAVGFYINNELVGKISENRLYAEGNYILPHGIKARIRGIYGIMNGVNVKTNQFIEGYAKLEKNIYNNPYNKYVKIVDIGAITHSYGYQYNQLDLLEERGILYGGYYSPSFYNSTVADANIEGANNKLRIHYGAKGFIGTQVSIRPDYVRLSWGFAPYLEYNLNDHIAVNVSYIFTHYSDSKCHILFVNTIFRGFKKPTKSIS